MFFDGKAFTFNGVRYLMHLREYSIPPTLCPVASTRTSREHWYINVAVEMRPLRRHRTPASA